MSRSDDLYRHLPRPLQHGAVTAFGAYWRWERFGPGYAGEVAGYEARERFTADEWAGWQHQQLQALLSSAAAHVPYYRETWDPDERRAAAAGALRDLPLLAKDPLRADPRRFLSDQGAPRRPLVFSTSGSSGTPIDSYWTTQELRRSMALREVRSARWAGVSFSLPRATFSGRLVEPDPDSDGPFHRYNAAERQVYLSAFHLRRETAAAYADAFRRHHVRWGTGYAVSFGLLAKAMLAEGVPPLRLDSVITTSEHLADDGRTAMAEAFGCRAFEEYSTVENVLFASECEAGSLHVSPDAGVVEILRDDGTPAGPGEVGEVVATGLLRTWQPFVRYRVGDRAAWSDARCRCGRPMPVLAEVSGRVEDVLVGPDGRQLVRFHGVFIGLPSVIAGQIVQEGATEFVVRVVPTAAFDDGDRAELAQRMHQRLGAGASVRVETVDNIERTSAGKFPAVVSHLDGPPSDAAPGSEAARVESVYASYDESGGRAELWSTTNPGNRAMLAERDRLLDAELDRRRIGDRRAARLLDVGCGRGTALAAIVARGEGFSPSRVVGLDLLPARLTDARRAGIELPLLAGDATAIPLTDGSIDVALALTVFSSIPDEDVSRRIVAELERVLRPGGLVLWYDLRRDNPRNPHVHGLDRPDVERLFAGWEVSLTPCTLLPPLARRLGPATAAAYGPLASIDLLRTHLVGSLRRSAGEHPLHE